MISSQRQNKNPHGWWCLNFRAPNIHAHMCVSVTRRIRIGVSRAVIYGGIRRSMTDRPCRPNSCCRVAAGWPRSEVDRWLWRWPRRRNHRSLPGRHSFARASHAARTHEAGTLPRSTVTFDHCEVCKPVYPC